MKKWTMIVDVAECTGCRNCTLATMDEYVDNAFPRYAAPMPKYGHRWIDVLCKERGRGAMIDAAYVPVTCNHCDNAPCVEKGGGAVKKRSDGIVIIDPDLAKGRNDLVDACPYGRIWWNEELQLPQAWPFDAHLLDQGWTKTRAELSCPTGAIRSVCVDDAELDRMVEDQGLVVMAPELGTKPRVYYRNLWRYSTCFIGGAIATEADGVVECVAGARVRLLKNGVWVNDVKSDAFGDFKLDRLPPDSGDYTLEIEAQGKPVITIAVTLGESVNLGEIRL